MASTKITFPVVGKQNGETIRRNAETGVEIRSSKLDRGWMEHSVYVPDAEHGYRLADYFGELTSAREEAADRVVYLREVIAAAHSEAISENADRALTKYCPELLAVDTDPEIAAELTEYARKQFPSVAAMLDPSGTTPLAATADDLAEVSRRVAEIASHLATVQPAAPARAVTVGDDVGLADLTEAQEYLVKRIVRRAAYETGKALLDVLAGWIEGAAENSEAMGRSENDPEIFHADNIRRMVNDACRVMGAPEAYRATS